MGCVKSREQPPPYIDEKLDAMARQALVAERQKIWDGAHHGYDEVFFMFPRLKKTSWPVLALDKDVYRTAMHMLKKESTEMPTQDAMVRLYEAIKTRSKCS